MIHVCSKEPKQKLKKTPVRLNLMRDHSKESWHPTVARGQRSQKRRFLDVVLFWLLQRFSKKKKNLYWFIPLRVAPSDAKSCLLSMGALSTKPNQKQRIALVNLRRLQSIQLEHDAMHVNGPMCGKMRGTKSWLVLNLLPVGWEKWRIFIYSFFFINDGA